MSPPARRRASLRLPTPARRLDLGVRSAAGRALDIGRQLAGTWPAPATTCPHRAGDAAAGVGPRVGAAKRASRFHGPKGLARGAVLVPSPGFLAAPVRGAAPGRRGPATDSSSEHPEGRVQIPELLSRPAPRPRTSSCRPTSPRSTSSDGDRLEGAAAGTTGSRYLAPLNALSGGMVTSTSGSSHDDLPEQAEKGVTSVVGGSSWDRLRFPPHRLRRPRSRGRADTPRDTRGSEDWSPRSGRGRAGELAEPRVSARLGRALLDEPES